MQALPIKAEINDSDRSFLKQISLTVIVSEYRSLRQSGIPEGDCIKRALSPWLMLPTDESVFEDMTSDTVVEVYLHGVYKPIFLNDTFLNLTNYTESDLWGRNIFDLFSRSGDLADLIQEDVVDSMDRLDAFVPRVRECVVKEIYTREKDTYLIEYKKMCQLRFRGIKPIGIVNVLKVTRLSATLDSNVAML